MIEDSRFGDQRDVAAIKTQSSFCEESLRRFLKLSAKLSCWIEFTVEESRNLELCVNYYIR